MTTSGGDSRVSIPTNTRKLIQEIKKTLGSNHTDDFVFATLKDCSMNPNEAGRRLKMIHGIREIAGKHSVEDVYTMLKECNMDPNEAAQRLLYIDTFHEVKKKQDRRKSISHDTSEEYKQTRGNQWRGANSGRGAFYASKVFDDAGGGRNSSSGKEYVVTKRLEVSGPAFPALSGKDNTAHVANSAANVNGKPAISNGSYLRKLVPELLTSDSVVVPSQNTRYTCSVGTIKCMIIKCSGCNESNNKMPAEKKFTADQVIAESADSDNKIQVKSDAVEENQPQLLDEPLKVIVTVSENTNSVPEKEPEVKLSSSKLDVDSVTEEESELNLSASKADMMIEKLNISSHRSVIFPDHFQVPENFKTQFTFGSLNATSDDSKSVTESFQQDGEIVTESSSSNENVPETAQEVEFKDQPLAQISENVSETAQEVEFKDQPLAQISENELNSEIVPEHSSSNENDSLTAQESESKDDPELPSEDDNISSDAAVKHEERNVDTMGGFQNPVLQSSRDYSYGFMPHMMGPHFVQLDAPELQNGSPLVGSAMGPTPTTQPGVAGQGSIALSAPLFTYFRQPYPNYIPYNPYYPHMYFPQNAHFVNHHGVFPHQPSIQTGVKYPAAALSQNKDSSNEDVTVSEPKHNNDIHSTVHQGEDPQVWAHAGGREVVPNLAPNYYYPFLQQAHHMSFSPFYQTMTPSQPHVYSTSGTLEQASNQNNTVLLNSQGT